METTLNKTIGYRIRKIRREKDIFQRDIAKQIGCAVSTISQYEKGTRQPSIAQLIKISKILGCRLEQITKDLDLEE